MIIRATLIGFIALLGLLPNLALAAPLDYEEHTAMHTPGLTADLGFENVFTDSHANLLLVSDFNGAFFTKLFVLLVIVVFALISFLKWLARKKVND